MYMNIISGETASNWLCISLSLSLYLSLPHTEAVPAGEGGLNVNSQGRKRDGGVRERGVWWGESEGREREGGGEERRVVGLLPLIIIVAIV